MRIAPVAQQRIILCKLLFGLLANCTYIPNRYAGTLSAHSHSIICCSPLKKKKNDKKNEGCWRRVLSYREIEFRASIFYHGPIHFLRFIEEDWARCVFTRHFNWNLLTRLVQHTFLSPYYFSFGSCSRQFDCIIQKTQCCCLCCQSARLLLAASALISILLLYVQALTDYQSNQF
jgi:hypothetical protein